MPESGTILIADRDATCTQAASDALGALGYACRLAADADSALAQLDADCDLLIAEPALWDGTDLRWVESLPHVREGLQVILAAANPAMEAAMQAVRLPVAAYLSKPLDLEELAAEARRAMQRRQALLFSRRQRQELMDWTWQLENLEQLAQHGGENLSAAINGILSTTSLHVVRAMSDLGQMVTALAGPAADQPACQLFHCPHTRQVRGVLEQTVAVLEKTRSAFKSKDLGQLREELQQFLAALPET